MKARISETPLNGKSVATDTQSTIAVDLTDEELARLGSMSREELIAIIQRMARQCGLIAPMTVEETAQAMLDTLAETALKPIVMGLNMKADIQYRMAAIDKWLDRQQGKPTQRIEQRIEHSAKMQASELTSEQLIAALRNANLAGLLPAGVKLLDNGDVITDASYVEVT